MAFKRLCRYLVGLPRMVFRYQWQSAETIDVYTDTDFAGCPRTRKSTSGGCVLIGKHTIKSWSSTQASIALSSGEAEFYGLVLTASEALGLVAMSEDFGDKIDAFLYADASAAIGVANREGLGRIRHLDTKSL